MVYRCRPPGGKRNNIIFCDRNKKKKNGLNLITSSYVCANVLMEIIERHVRMINIKKNQLRDLNRLISLTRRRLCGLSVLEALRTAGTTDTVIIRVVFISFPARERVAVQVYAYIFHSCPLNNLLWGLFHRRLQKHAHTSILIKRSSVGYFIPSHCTHRN